MFSNSADVIWANSNLIIELKIMFDAFKILVSFPCFFLLDDRNHFITLKRKEKSTGCIIQDFSILLGFLLLRCPILQAFQIFNNAA
jgi:hypothetical protein